MYVAVQLVTYTDSLRETLFCLKVDEMPNA